MVNLGCMAMEKLTISRKFDLPVNLTKLVDLENEVKVR